MVIPALWIAAVVRESVITAASRPSGIGESSGGWIIVAIVLAVLAGLTFFAFRKPGGSGGKRGFGPLGTFGGDGDDGLGRKSGTGG